MIDFINCQSLSVCKTGLVTINDTVMTIEKYSNNPDLDSHGYRSFARNLQHFVSQMSIYVRFRSLSLLPSIVSILLTETGVGFGLSEYSLFSFFSFGSLFISHVHTQRCQYDVDGRKPS